MLHADDIALLCSARHGDPFAVLGVHAVDGGWEVRTLQPGALAVTMIDASTGARLAELARRDPAGFFEGAGRGAPPRNYRYEVRWTDGSESTLDDAYRHGPVLGETDAWLLAEGSHLRPYEVLGARLAVHGNVPGAAFAVWAPNASRVAVVGDFNHWDGRRHPMRLRRECGVWELFVPGVGAGAHYKYELRARDGHVLPLKADPYALQSEMRPQTASVVARLPAAHAPSPARRAANALDAPMSIYEVHLGSWRRKIEGGNRFLDWAELADELVAYAQHMGYTHLELLPVTEHPFDGSWGYQPIGLYSVTARFGEPAGLRRFVERAHAAGIGVIVDWVPAHFPTDPHGLGEFDGTRLYEYADPREGFHQDWNTLIYNFGRTEVRNFLVANALFWLERYGIDGLRVDAVASMLYRDYSRAPDQWVPNVHGGRENLEAIAFLRRMNEVVGVERPDAVTLAEESTAFPAVSRPPHDGGLGFHYKWNMGWMHDTLAYMKRDPVHRRFHHHELTFGLVYAFNENFVLPLSHDEVVHGKGSLIGKMPGDRWQQFANLRCYYGFMYGHPGKKLLFMGGEFAQQREWAHDHSLDWHLLEDPLHAGVQQLVRDLNHYYRATPALYQDDFSPDGFRWIDHTDADRSLLVFVRRGRAYPGGAGSLVLVVCNFTPVVHHALRIGVPEPGQYHERINTDSAYYGGSNVGTPLGVATAQPWASHGQPHSILVDVPPLATVLFERMA
jgi:1,4-alpha-glucan branching enzyme